MRVDIGNRWVWITGASSGIGASLAREAAAKGARLLLSGRNLAALAAVAAECESISRSSGRAGGHEVLPFDLLDRAARAAAVQQALAKTGGVALLVLNAGISQRCRFEDMTPEAFDRVMELDFAAPVDLVRRVLPSWGGDRLPPSGILFVSSIAGLIGAPRRTAYVAAKHALTGFASVLRGEIAERKVSVTVAFPAYVRTGIAKAALSADGKPRGVDDPDIAGGADPDKVAAKMLRAALAGKTEIKLAFTFESHFALFATRHLPGLYARLAAARGRAMASRSSES